MSLQAPKIQGSDALMNKNIRRSVVMTAGITGALGEAAPAAGQAAPFADAPAGTVQGTAGPLAAGHAGTCAQGVAGALTPGRAQDLRYRA